MALFFSFCLPSGKAGGLHIPCCQGIAVADYSFTPDALALKPSSFCNVGVYKSQIGIGKELQLSERPGYRQQYFSEKSRTDRSAGSGSFDIAFDLETYGTLHASVC